MSRFDYFAKIRREYGQQGLTEESINADPIAQFQLWFHDVLAHDYEHDDPTAMVLSTVDELNRPDSRVVLLKGIIDNEFIFYTNYQSHKAAHIQSNNHAALNFYWPSIARQIRVRGYILLLNAEQSDNYFSSRPIKSQLSAIISPQSAVIPNRAFLEEKLAALSNKNYDNKSLPRPTYWGGYRFIPNEFEFWQGRDNRLHDRMFFYQQDSIWHHHRLAP